MSIDVLLVEDNEGDVRLVREAFLEVNKNVRLHVVHDGAEAMAFLKYQGGYLDAPRPDFILLDLHIPKMHGLEVLAAVKANRWLRSIPIVILTASDTDSDIAQSYSLMANCFVTKAKDLKGFEELVKSLNDFWVTRVTFPRQGERVRKD